MKASHIIIAILILSGAGLVFFSFKDKLFGKSKTPTPPDTAPDLPPTPGIDHTRTLARGSKGEEVIHLQSLLNKVLTKRKITPLVVDGIFGPFTENALLSVLGVKSTNLISASEKILTELSK